jgi:hypothetical protein
MGALSRSEQMAEADLLNPLASSMGQSLRGAIKQKLLYTLIDTNEQSKLSRQMFEATEYEDA